MMRGKVGGKREKHGVSNGHEYRFTKRKKKRGTQTQTQSQVHVDALLIASSHRIPSRIASSTALDLLTFILSEINNNKGHKDNDYGDLLVSDAFLAITPTLLRSRLSKMLLQTLEILGFAALYSYEKNRKVADDNEIIVVIISLLSSNNEDIVKGACNAMLDLATTLTGRRQLQEHKAIDQLLLLFCQAFNVDDISKVTGRQVGWRISSSKKSHLCFERNKILQFVLDALNALIFVDGGENLSVVSKEHSLTALSCFISLWIGLQNEEQEDLLNQDCACFCKMKSFSASKEHILAKLIFRLAVEQDILQGLTVSADKVKSTFFGDNYSCFEHFVKYHWESSPLLIRNFAKIDGENKKLFFLDAKYENVGDLLQQLLKGSVSCPPLTADNIDIREFLEEMENNIGYPMIYGQDIRFVKSNIEDQISSDFASEFNQSSDRKGKKSVCLHDCMNAYKMGYTISIRGMEFRNREIAEIADASALMFGQASVGANIYLTPPTSQGLSIHYDDHCVIVMQLVGCKKWAVFPPKKLLPQLYEPLNMVSTKKYLINHVNELNLLKGDVLYIPRGFPHLAYTISKESCQYFAKIQKSDTPISAFSCQSGLTVFQNSYKDNSCIKFHDSSLSEKLQSGSVNVIENHKICELMGDKLMHDFEGKSAEADYSLHITFGVEVEAPFEWEGMLHIALHCWRENLESDHFIKICGSENCYFLLIQLLHVSIRVVGSHCSILRKACTASALFPACNDAIGQSDTELLPPKQIFHCLIKLVAESCNLSDAYENVGEAFRDFRDDDPLEWMKWFRHLRTNDASNQQHWYSPAKQTRSLFLLYQTSILDYETAFLQIKSKFCEETNFDEAHKVFNSLLNKYRNARKRYSEGMLALHQS